MNRTWKHGLVAVPGIGASLLPKLACPVCWPAYAGLLSSVGLGFLISSRYLLALTAVAFVPVLMALAFRAKNRHGYGPLMLGTVAAAGVLVGKFQWQSKAELYFAVGLLLVASIWNVWPRHHQSYAQPVLDA